MSCLYFSSAVFQQKYRACIAFAWMAYVFQERLKMNYVPLSWEQCDFLQEFGKVIHPQVTHSTNLFNHHSSESPHAEVLKCANWHSKSIETERGERSNVHTVNTRAPPYNDRTHAVNLYSIPKPTSCILSQHNFGSDDFFSPHSHTHSLKLSQSNHLVILGENISYARHSFPDYCY